MQELVINVLVIIFLTTILDLLLPDGKMQPFIRLVMGLFVLITILQPVLKIIDDDSWLDAWILTDNLSTKEESIMVQGESLYDKSSEMVLNEYREQMEKQISGLVYLLDGVDACRTEITVSSDDRLGNVGQIEQVTIYLEGEFADKWQTEEKIKKMLASYYTLAEETIEVR